MFTKVRNNQLMLSFVFWKWYLLKNKDFFWSETFGLCW